MYSVLSYSWVFCYIVGYSLEYGVWLFYNPLSSLIITPVRLYCYVLGIGSCISRLYSVNPRYLTMLYKVLLLVPGCCTAWFLHLMRIKDQRSLRPHIFSGNSEFASPYAKPSEGRCLRMSLHIPEGTAYNAKAWYCLKGWKKPPSEASPWDS